MCGIIGMAGKTKALPMLLEGLERLEYRGYDSAGVAVIDDTGEISVRKTKGRISALREFIESKEKLEGKTGIGHTRWATHGEPNDVNAHPHLGGENKIAVVHNGIIENYLEIKEFLIRRGITFFSDTDTEVIAQLLEYYYSQGMNIIDAVYKVLERIRGAYAMGILCTDNPEQIIAARKDAPLLIGYGDGVNYIASDITAIVPYTRSVSYMEDYELAVITPKQVQVYDKDACIIGKEVKTIDWDVTAAEKGGYAHFMLKEIMEQPVAVKNTITPRIDNGKIFFEELSKEPDFLKDVHKIYITACGSAYHVGVVGKYVLEELLKIPVEVVLASEFRYSNPLVDGNTLVIIISQSGETADSVAALREAKSCGARVLSIVNVVGSSIARESDITCYTWAGPEIAVATTKAYTTQMSLLILLGVYFAGERKAISDEVYDDIVKEFLALPAKLEEVLSNIKEYQKEASNHFNHTTVFFIGRHLDYALGLEGSLKLKEISYVHSESYAAGELKHGTISLIEPGTLVVALAMYEPLLEKTRSNIVEVKSRGADVLLLTTCKGEEMLKSQADGIFALPYTNKFLQPILGVVPLQLFAYYVALDRGCDIDKPRNLAKSVTVE